MCKPVDSIWYDGEERERADVIQRVERDAAEFLERVIAGYIKDGSEWSILIEQIRVQPPAGFGGPDADPSPVRCQFELDDDGLLVSPQHHFQHLAEGLFAQIQAKLLCDN